MAKNSLKTHCRCALGIRTSFPLDPEAFQFQHVNQFLVVLFLLTLWFAPSLITTLCPLSPGAGYSSD